jgi:peptidoglycan/LPS O-acetylase OafA/YrhL
MTNRLDWLDALRGWAVLGVVTVHAGQAVQCTGITHKITAAGQYGVQLFFIVSALTISLTYESHLREFGKSFRSQFAWFIKRYFRIAPLYYLAAIYYPLEQYAIHAAGYHYYAITISPGNLAANFLFVHTWIPAANGSVVPGGWSIGVEMFFYLLVPLIWSVAPVKRRIILLAVGAIASLLVTILAVKLTTGSYFVPESSFFYFWFPSQAPVIAIGLIFYFLYGPILRQPRSTNSARLCLVGFMVCLLLALYCGTLGKAAPVLSPTILAISFVLLILGLHGWVMNCAVNKFAIALGKISYSVYIFHFSILDCIRPAMRLTHTDRFGALALLPVLAATLLLTCGLACFSKRIIEDPSIAFGHRLSRSVATGSR